MVILDSHMPITWSTLKRGLFLSWFSEFNIFPWWISLSTVFLTFLQTAFLFFTLSIYTYTQSIKLFKKISLIPFSFTRPDKTKVKKLSLHYLQRFDSLKLNLCFDNKTLKHLKNVSLLNKNFWQAQKNLILSPRQVISDMISWKIYIYACILVCLN